MLQVDRREWPISRYEPNCGNTYYISYIILLRWASGGKETLDFRSQTELNGEISHG